MPDRRGRQRVGDPPDPGSDPVRRLNRSHRWLLPCRGRPIGCRSGSGRLQHRCCGGWCRRIITRWCPETANICHYMLQSLGLGWIQAIHTTAIALLADGMGHHVGLNGNGPPGIENKGGAPDDGPVAGPERRAAVQSLRNGDEGVCPCSIGSTDADVGVRLQSQQGIRQRFQGS